MYNDLPKINDLYEKDYFDDLLNKISIEIAAKELGSLESRQTYADAYKKQLLSLIESTPSIYYQTLRLAFDKYDPADINKLVDTSDFPIDLLSSIEHSEPEALYSFLQYIREEDVQVISPTDANRYYSDMQLSLETTQILDEEYEPISPEEQARNLEVAPEAVSKKIGRSAASCEVISTAVERLVQSELGLDEFSIIDSPSDEGKQRYDELINTIADLPAVCYGMIHAVAADRLIPSFYNTRGHDYLEPDKSLHQDDLSEDELFSQKFEHVISAARTGDFGIYSVSEAKQYYEFYSSREVPAKTVTPSAETLGRCAEEQTKKLDALAKLTADEKAAAQKSADTRFGNYIKMLQKNKSVCKEEYDFLTQMSKIYKKENALFQSANEKFLKAELAVQKLQTIDDFRDLTPKESAQLSKAMAELSKAEKRLEAIRNDLITKSEQRAAESGKFSEHFEMRKEQLLSGDTTYIPLHTREDSINNKMYSYEAQIYASAHNEMFDKSPEIVPFEQPDREPVTRPLNLGSFTKQTVRYEIDHSRTFNAHEMKREEKQEDEISKDD